MADISNKIMENGKFGSREDYYVYMRERPPESHPRFNQLVKKESILKRLKTIKERYGKLTAWNKGLPCDIKTKEKISNANKGHRYSPNTEFKKGHNISKEENQKRIRGMKNNLPSTTFKKGNIPFMKGKTQPLDTIEKIKKSLSKHKEYFSNSMKKRRREIVLPLKDTSIEVKIQNFLKQLNIEFFTHQYIKEIEHGYQCDILIPEQKGIKKKTIIECYGDYWHKYPMGREIDWLRCRELRESGWRVIVLWEREIKVVRIEEFERGVITD